MLSLIIATFCSASIALIFKWTEGSDKNRYVVTSINYLTATLVSFALGGINQFQSFNPWVLIIGIPAGVFFFFKFCMVSDISKKIWCRFSWYVWKTWYITAYGHVPYPMERMAYTYTDFWYSIIALCHCTHSKRKTGHKRKG